MACHLVADILDVGANIGLFSLFCHLHLPQPPQSPALPNDPHRGAAAAGDVASAAAAEEGEGERGGGQTGVEQARPPVGGLPAGRARNRVFAFEPVPAIYEV